MKNPDFLGLSKLCVWAFFIFILLASGFDEGSQGGEYCVMVAVASLPLAILFRGAYNGTQPQKSKTPEEIKAAQDAREAREMLKRMKAENQRPVSAVLISVEYRQSTMEALGRAAIGDWLYGDIGAIVGATTTPEKAKKATFRVRYASGRTGTETVAVGSKRFNQLSALLDD